ncbi:hypothetical protein C0J52_01963 [Blattella germanica]|nr:hypothetical protein C0J52_01963 [Blattella germanica]
MKQKKEIEELQKKLHSVEHEYERRSKDLDMREKKCEIQRQQLEVIMLDRDKLEQQYEQLKNERTNLLRTLEQEHKKYKADEAKALAMIRDSKIKWEKKHQEQISNLEKQIEVLYVSNYNDDLNH